MNDPIQNTHTTKLEKATKENELNEMKRRAKIVSIISYRFCFVRKQN